MGDRVYIMPEHICIYIYIPLKHVDRKHTQHACYLSKRTKTVEKKFTKNVRKFIMEKISRSFWSLDLR